MRLRGISARDHGTWWPIRRYTEERGHTTGSAHQNGGYGDVTCADDFRRPRSGHPSWDGCFRFPPCSSISRTKRIRSQERAMAGSLHRVLTHRPANGARAALVSVPGHLSTGLQTGAISTPASEGPTGLGLVRFRCYSMLSSMICRRTSVLRSFLSRKATAPASSPRRWNSRSG